MNIFSLIAAALGCATAFGITWLLVTKSINIKFISTSEETVVEPAPVVEKKDEPEVTKAQEPVNMDAVIKAANELMGIDVGEDEHGRFY